jgi:Transposase DDE domain group 1
VMRDGRPVTVDVTADGAGLVSHAGSALLAQVADKLGLTRAMSLRLAALKQRRRGHDPGRVLRDLAVMLANGGECVSDRPRTPLPLVGLSASVAEDASSWTDEQPHRAANRHSGQESPTPIHEDAAATSVTPFGGTTPAGRAVQAASLRRAF